MPFFTISGDTEEPIMHDQLSGLAAFVQAVKAGSFAEAAQRMQLTRSAVGKSIARLEHRVGARLFHRTTRQLNHVIECHTLWHNWCRRSRGSPCHNLYLRVTCRQPIRQS